MPSHQLSEQFVSQLTACQSRVYAYITTLVHDPVAAQDILQEANLVLCRKAAEVNDDMDFVGWACRIAYYQVLAHRRDAGRDRHHFDDALLSQLAERSAARSASFEQRSLALRTCMGKLTDAQRDLLHRRYTDNQSIKSVAESLGRPAGSITQTLHRIRKTLLECIGRHTAEDDSA